MAIADVRKEQGDERLFRGDSQVVEEEDAEEGREPDPAADRRLPATNTARASLAARTRKTRAAAHVSAPEPVEPGSAGSPTGTNDP